MGAAATATCSVGDDGGHGERERERGERRVAEGASEEHLGYLGIASGSVAALEGHLRRVEQGRGHGDRMSPLGPTVEHLVHVVQSDLGAVFG
jgi:hypothetical protein